MRVTAWVHERRFTWLVAGQTSRAYHGQGKHTGDSERSGTDRTFEMSDTHDQRTVQTMRRSIKRKPYTEDLNLESLSAR